MSAPNTTAGPIPILAQERVLFWCVLASIALHAFALLGLSSREAPAVKPQLVLTARLVPIPVALPEPVEPKPALPVPPEPVAAPRPKLAKPSAKPPAEVKRTAPAEPVEAPRPESAPAAPSVEASAAPPATAIQAMPAPVAPSATSVPATPAPAAPARVPATEAAAKSGNDADTGTLEQYRLALIVATRRYKRYPAIALEKGWQGRVDVHMVIDANGMVAGASIKTGSGYEVLDKQALDMLKKGKTTVPIPAGLRGREFSIDVPVIFNLENSNS